jgi:hypothetical protein
MRFLLTSARMATLLKAGRCASNLSTSEGAGEVCWERTGLKSAPAIR